MMESKKEVMHTPEPWFSYDKGNIWRRHPNELYENGGGVAGDKPIAMCDRGWYGDYKGYPESENARRIVACVNACKHYTTEDLEDVGENLSGVFSDVRARCAELIAQRDELLAALKPIIERVRFFEDCGPYGETWQSDELIREIIAADDAVAKCEVQP